MATAAPSRPRPAPQPSTNGTPKASPAMPAAGLLAKAPTSGRKLPTRLVLYAQEKWGKTSFAAMAPTPFFICNRGETGLETLIDEGILPETKHHIADNWSEASLYVNALICEDHNYKTLVLDTGNGISRLCEEDVCRRQFGNDWSEKGYNSFGTGIKASIAPWSAFLDNLDRLRERRNMSIIILCHAQTKNFPHPELPAFTRFVPEMPDKLWGQLHKWADVILFGDFHTVIEKERGEKAKGRGGSQRLLRTTPNATCIAGHRHNLPNEINCGTNHVEAWSAFVAALKSGKQPNA